MNWKYAITSVPERWGTTLFATVRSLYRGGFQKPPVFVDSPADLLQPRRLGGTVVVEADGADNFYPVELIHATARAGCFGNWVRAATELYHSDPDADRYAIFQDDIVCGQNLRQWFDASPPPENAYANLCTYPENLIYKPGSCWYPAPDRRGLGAQALVFSNAAMQALLNSPWLRSHPKDRHRGHRAVDGVVKTAMKDAGFTEFVHTPSPVKHCGQECSTLGTVRQPETAAFVGADFDLMMCVKESV